jgi:uncharacterized protein (TIGR01244 family)
MRTTLTTLLTLSLAALLIAGCASPMERGLNLDRVGVAESVPDEQIAAIRNVTRDGRFTFAGAPEERGLRYLAADGYEMVVNLRTDREMQERVDFDEASLVRSLGMTYEQIPVSGDTFSPDDVDRFAEALARVDGPVLIHCASSGRVGMMWAAYLHRKRGFSKQEAIEKGEAAGLGDRESTRAALQRVMNAPK